MHSDAYISNPVGIRPPFGSLAYLLPMRQLRLLQLLPTKLQVSCMLVVLRTQQGTRQCAIIYMATDIDTNTYMHGPKTVCIWRRDQLRSTYITFRGAVIYRCDLRENEEKADRAKQQRNAPDRQQGHTRNRSMPAHKQRC